MISIENFDLRKRFSLGIDFLDEDYREIFQNIRELIKALDKNDRESAVKITDTITELTEKHYEAEEGYIRFGLAGSFMYHKHCHDIMREKILPQFKDACKKQDMLKIERITGTYLGFTASHILFEDDKLKNKYPDELKYKVKKDTSGLEKSLGEVVGELLGAEVSVTPSSMMLCELDDPVAYERTYNLNDEAAVKVRCAFEEKLLLSFIEDAFHIKLSEPTLLAKCLLSEFTKEASQKMISLFKFGTFYQRESEKEMTFDQLEMSIACKKPAYELSFKMPKGSFIIFADKI